MLSKKATISGISRGGQARTMVNEMTPRCAPITTWVLADQPPRELPEAWVSLEDLPAERGPLARCFTMRHTRRRWLPDCFSTHTHWVAARGGDRAGAR